MNNGDLKVRFQPILTLNNARAWFRETAKWVYVTGLLHDAGIAYAPPTDSVERHVHMCHMVIEREFDRILIAAGE